MRHAHQARWLAAAGEGVWAQPVGSHPRRMNIVRARLATPGTAVGFLLGVAVPLVLVVAVQEWEAGAMAA